MEILFLPGEQLLNRTDLIELGETDRKDLIFRFLKQTPWHFPTFEILIGSFHRVPS